MNLRPVEEYVPLTPHALQVLLALADRPCYGYGIMMLTHEDSGGVVTLTRGTVYRTLRGLLAWGLIEELPCPGWGPGRDARWYGLTQEGTTVLEWEVERARMIVHLGYERLGKPKNELEGSFFKGFVKAA